MRRCLWAGAGVIAVAVAAILTIALTSHSPSAPKTSLPRVLAMHTGVQGPRHSRRYRWNSPISKSETTCIRLKSARGHVAWAVWSPQRRHGCTRAIYPVRTLDGGREWTVVGPALASNGSGDGAHQVASVFTLSSRVVVMTGGGSTIDVSTNSGRAWYQFSNPTGGWAFRIFSVPGGVVEMRLSLQRGGIPATYILQPAAEQWFRTTTS